MRVVLLGATGQIGSALLARARKDGLDAIGTTRKPSNSFGLIQFNPFVDDWKVLGRVDVLINCIGNIYETRSESFVKLHVELIKLLIKNRDLIGGPKVINVSALGASAKHPVSFLRTKGVGDEALLTEVNTYVIRPSIVCTPDTMLLRKLKMLRRIAKYTANHLLLPKSFLSTSIQPIHIDDLTELIIHVALNIHHQRIIDAVGPEPISYHQLLKFAFANSSPKFSYTEMNRRFFGVLVRYAIAPFFPSLASYEQFQLLFSDNTSDDENAERILGRKLGSTADFWKTHLGTVRSIYLRHTT